MQINKLKLLAEYGKRTKELAVYGALPEGYYLIKEVESTLVNNYPNIKAHAFWNPKSKDVGQSDYPIYVNLSSLYNRFSVGPKEYNPNSLKGVIINVKLCTIHEYEYDGVPKRQALLEWDIVSFAQEEAVIDQN